MALFLQRRNNLADVESVDEARLNLGLGSLSTFNSNNVHITGGSIKADSVTIKSRRTRNRVASSFARQTPVFLISPM